jgi:hypothetical protein
MTQYPLTPKIYSSGSFSPPLAAFVADAFEAPLMVADGKLTRTGDVILYASAYGHSQKQQP